MKMGITIPVGEHNYYYSILKYSNSEKIIHEGTIYLGIYKIHDHKYELTAFIYKKHKYVYPRYYKTKKELYGAV